MFVNIVRWRVPIENSKKQFELWNEIMEYQRSHPEKVFYIRSRFFTFTEKGSSEENWMFLDEYKNREDFDKGMKTVKEDPEFKKLSDEFFPKWDAIIVAGSRKHEFWTEVEKLKVEPPPKKWL
jgi:nicotinamidase-related amidase